MKIPVVLNGNRIELQANPEDSLMSVLRKLGCNSVKCGCGQGLCGSCTILFNDLPSAACKIPAGIAINSDITTMEYFSQTEEYRAIMQGFELAQISLCGYCNSGKIFSVYQILKAQKCPERGELIAELKYLAPCCTDLNSLINGAIYAWDIVHNGYENVVKKLRNKR